MLDECCGMLGTVLTGRNNDDSRKEEQMSDVNTEV